MNGQHEAVQVATTSTRIALLHLAKGCTGRTIADNRESLRQGSWPCAALHKGSIVVEVDCVFLQW